MKNRRNDDRSPQPGDVTDRQGQPDAHGAERAETPAEHDISDAGQWGDDLESRVAALQAQLEESHNKYLRTIADYQNSQRRALQNEQQAKADGVSRVITDVATIIDHLDLALNQDGSRVTSEAILSGVRVIREELVRVLNRHGVTLIHPQPGEEFQPGRHEAVMQQPSNDVPPGTVVSTFQPGFLLTGGAGERVIRPAKVAVSPAS